jgi:2-oxoglutarate dehydrogenase complex dehydrogenase (E1) component-like enzyme
VIDDQHFEDQGTTNAPDRAAVTRIMICSGKIFYELNEERTNRQNPRVAIVRLEQLYPWPEQELAAILERYPKAKEIFFIQEEPRNMGAWMYFQGMWTGALSNFGARFPKLGLTYVGREICASPAVGSKKLHDFEQKEIVTKAFQE